MDLITVDHFRQAHTRNDLVLAENEMLLGGGTWIFSEPLLGTRGLVDLTTMPWPAYKGTDDGLTISSTCTVAELASMPLLDPTWRAHPLMAQCCTAFLASFKVWNVMTVGGNIMRSFAAAPMVSLAAALDGNALFWCADGRDVTVPVATMVTGNGTNNRASDDVLRSVTIPRHALQSQTAYRKIALSEIGRSGAVLIGRVDRDGSTVFTLTASTQFPVQLRYAKLPSARTLRDDVHGIDAYYTDPLGTADWREQVSAVLLEEIRQELDEKVSNDGF